MHEDCPVFDWNVPAAHCRHARAWLVSLNVPVPHAGHEVWPVRLLAVPGSQFWQAELAVLDVYVPTGQSKHAEAPVDGW